MDRQRLREVLDATELFRPAEIDVALELFDAAVGRANDDYHWLAAYDDGDRLIGAACWGATPATEGTFDLYWILVDPEAQGAGVGSSLLSAVEESLRRDGARLLLIETSGLPQYAPTRGFYRRRGYGEAQRIEDFYAPGDARVTFVKRLAAGAVTAPPLTTHVEQRA
ncbi:MAG TPA: GNAT family N-acetyltransferase [Gemmatimonadaceae bacterium]|nr:GNAT family N-acetyltransferase [Gemmatimonadaceae bacterium]